MQMKWHNNLISAVIEGLDKIFLQKKYANKVVKNIIEKNKKWGARDRGLISQTIFECVRWYRKYIYCSGLKELNRTRNKIYCMSQGVPNTRCRVKKIQ